MNKVSLWWPRQDDYDFAMENLAETARDEDLRRGVTLTGIHSHVTHERVEIRGGNILMR